MGYISVPVRHAEPVETLGARGVNALPINMVSKFGIISMMIELRAIRETAREIINELIDR